MKKNIFKGIVCIGMFLLIFMNISGAQPVYAVDVGKDKVHNLYQNQGYRYFPKLSNVSVDKFFTVRFSKEINYSTVNNNSIELIEKASGDKVRLDFEKIEDKAVMAIPQEPLIKGKTYYLLVHKSIKTQDNLHTVSTGIITEVSVGDVYSSFMVKGANFISQNKVEVRFNEVVNYTKASTRQYYKINGMNPSNVTVSENGKAVVLTLEDSPINTNEDIVVFISNSITNSFGKYLVNNYEIELDRNIYNETIENTPNGNISLGSGDVYFNALPPKIYGSTNEGVQRFEIIVQVIGGTFKEDLNGTNYDRAFSVVSLPTGFNIGTKSDGSSDINAVKRVSPNVLKIRIDGRFPLLQDDNILLEFSESALNENGDNILLKNRTLKIEVLTD